MKNTVAILLLVVGCAVTGLLVARLRADEDRTFQTYEYARIRWGGRENTHLIRPNGQVEMLTPLLSHVKRPDRTDERALLMNIALNAVAREGYELASMTEDSLVLRRAIRK